MDHEQQCSDWKNQDVVWRTFPCHLCQTKFVTNRAEPFCIADHPGQYHLQGIIWNDRPCRLCMTWWEPWIAHGSEGKMVYPPPRVVAEPGYCGACLKPLGEKGTVIEKNKEYHSKCWTGM